MVALRVSLFKRCCTALTPLNVFASMAELESVFSVRELSAYKSHMPIPYATTPREAFVRQVVSWLLEQNADEQGPQLFLTFLRTLLFLEKVPAPSSQYEELSICCALLEIEHVLIRLENGKRYDLQAVTKLVEYFHTSAYRDDSTIYRRVRNQLPREIVARVRDRLPEFDIPDIMRLFTACLYVPDGVGQLSWFLGNESPQWQELERLVCHLSKTDVTYAQLRQLESILASIEWEREVLLKAYRASMSEEASDVPVGDKTALLRLMLDSLGKSPQNNNATLPILEFAKRMGQYAGQQQQDVQKKIEGWIRERLRDLGKNIPQYMSLLDTQLQDREPPMSEYLLVAVEPWYDQRFEIRAWLMDSENQLVEEAEPYISGEPVLLEDIPGCIDEIHQKYADYLVNDLTVEVFLPPQYLPHFAVDHWQIDGGTGRKRKLGGMHKLVVRCLERARNRMIRGVWRKKWELFQGFVHGPMPDEAKNYARVKGPFWMCEEQDCENENALVTELRASYVVCLAMGFIPSSLSETDLFNAVSETGVPIALWARASMKSQEDSFNSFKSLLQDKNFSQTPKDLLGLPGWIKGQRVEAAWDRNGHHHGHHLTLLWEDPNRLPPNVRGQFKYQRGKA